MAISAPKLSDIQSQIVSDIESKTGQSIPLLAKAVWKIWAFALAGIWLILYKYGSDAFKQRFAQTASRKFLILIGGLIGINIQSATIWDGQAQVTSTTDQGNLEAGIQLVNNNTGTVYTVTTTIAKSIGTMTFDLASTVSGEIGDLLVSDVLDFVSPIPGLANTATISTVTTSGEDEEDLEIYRRRVINGYQKKPQGGAEADYEEWGLEASNAISIFPFPTPSVPGQVDIYAEVDNQTDGIPTSAQLTTIEQYIKYDPTTGRKTRRPMTAELNMYAITRSAYDLNITGLSPDTTDNRTAINTAVTELLLAKAPYVDGLTVTRNDSISQAECFSTVFTTASNLGATISGVTLEKASVQIDLDVLSAGEKAKLGTITWI